MVLQPNQPPVDGPMDRATDESVGLSDKIFTKNDVTIKISVEYIYNTRNICRVARSCADELYPDEGAVEIRGSPQYSVQCRMP